MHEWKHLLVPPDPVGVADAWERLLVRLESIGAAVEPERPGSVCFDAGGLLRLLGRHATLASPGAELRHPAEEKHDSAEVLRHRETRGTFPGKVPRLLPQWWSRRLRWVCLG